MTHHTDFIHALHSIYSKSESKGKKTRKELGDLVSINFLREVIYSIEEVSIGTEQLMYFVGKKYGKEIVASYIKGKSEEKILEHVKKLFKNNKVGILKIESIGDTQIIVHLKECAISHGAPIVDKPICFFISGYLAGVMEGKLNKSYMVNETMCCALGDEFCEFIIRRV